ncbi:hypothetical protein GPECTOR_11g254 [Gonium pectorale]|uniref:Uncharacterized protein n=1 Tax=Gonium pectorale TaxID=33097 RepID=A0A150GPQ4_GONPE|nr:hypothetical protein GPECTOR_11g254 [Gonium pectorale]|eukprot:KXZ51813.1 hypothetical protein GPECTOR_11g254 [Gonium pectorale]
MLDALDALEAQLRACGVGGGGAALSLPGAEEPDLVVACAALLFGRCVWEVAGPQRTAALMGFGGTLSRLSPTAAAVIASWLYGLREGSGRGGGGGGGRGGGGGGGGRGRGSGLPAAAQRLSDKSMEVLAVVACESLRLQVDSAGLCSWACLMQLREDDVEPMRELVAACLPGAQLLPHAAITFNASGTSIQVRGRSTVPYGGSNWVHLEPGHEAALLTFCMPDPCVVGGLTQNDLRYFKIIQRPYNVDCKKRVLRDDLTRGLPHLFAGLMVERALRGVTRRLEALGAGALAGCSWEHCAALSGDPAATMSLLAQHEAWWQVSEQLQGDEQQQRVRAGLRARLLQQLPAPPAPPGPPPPQRAGPGHGHAGEGDGDEEDDDGGVGAARRAALEREVDAFIADLMPLTHARYMAVPRSGADAAPSASGSSGRLAEELVAAEPLEAEAMRGWATIKLQFRTAHTARKKALAAATHPPAWLPPALLAATSLALAIVLYALEYVLLASVQRTAPAVLLDAVETAMAAAVRAADRLAAALAPPPLAAPTWERLAARAAWWLLWRFRPLWMWLPPAVAGTRAAAARLPDVWQGVVEAAADRFGLGNFLGRYNLRRLQRRVDAQQRAWSLRLAEARMREAVGRGRISRGEVLRIMAALQAAGCPPEQQGGGGGDDDGDDGKALLPLPVAAPPPEQPQAGSAAEGGYRAKSAAPHRRAGAAAAGAGAGGPTGGSVGKRGIPTGEAAGQPAAAAAAGAAGPAAASGSRAGGSGGAGAPRRQGGRGHKAVSKMLEQEGWTVVRRGKHIVYRRVLSGGTQQTFVRSSTPSDWRTAANQVAALRRLNSAAQMEMVLAASVLAPGAARSAGAQAGAADAIEGALAALLHEIEAALPAAAAAGGSGL